jgi:hypothetical protein
MKTLDLSDEELPEPVAQRAQPSRQIVRVVRQPEPEQPGRILPHSLESEECLLGCVLIDGVESLEKCEEAGIEPRSFYDKKHEVIYARLLRMRADGLEISDSILYEELKKARELDAIGGYTAITQLTRKVPTTAQRSYFIERVREQSILRRVINAGIHTVESAYSFTGDVEAFVQEQSERVKGSINGYVQGAPDERRYDHTRQRPKPDATFLIGGVPVCTPGNLTTIYSQAKTGKSSFLAAMMAATMTNPTSGHDTLGVTGPNYGEKAVLHFDTEQAPYDWEQLVRSSLRRVHLQQPPPWLHSYTLAGLEAQKAERTMLKAITAAAKAHGGIHSVFIDGVADLVNDPNSSDDCFPLVTRLQALAIAHDCPVINILHLNPAAKDKADKGRGHLGSQLERKSESNLTLKKDGDTTVVIGEGRQRHQPIPADKSPAFRWSDEHAMHRSCAAPVSDGDGKRSTGGRPTTYEYSTYADLMPKKNTPGLPLSQLAKKLSVNKPVTAKALYNVLVRWEQDGLIEVVSTGSGKLYRQAV